MIVCDEYEAKNGWGNYTKGLVQALEKGHQVRVVSKHSGSTVRRSKIYGWGRFNPTYNIFKQLYFVFAFLRYFRWADVIHVTVEIFAPAASIASRLYRKPYVLTLHGTYAIPVKEDFPSVRRIGMKFALNHAHNLTSGSQYTIDMVQESLHRKIKCKLIPNGVDNQRFFPDYSQQPSSLKFQYPYIISIGQIKMRKGFDQVIKVISDSRVNSRIHYVIVGDTSNSSELEKLKLLASHLDVERRVHFFANISDIELRRLISQSICLVVPSRRGTFGFEGSPLVIMEAFSCGTPVIATSGYGSDYTVNHGKNGFLVNVEDLEAIASSINKIYNDRSSFSDNCILYANLNTWDSILPQILELYSSSNS